MYDPELRAHKDWLGLLQPVGLVVSPPALVRMQVVLNRGQVIDWQEDLRMLVAQAEAHHEALDFEKLAIQILGWEPSDLVTDAQLDVALPEYEEFLAPTYAVPDPDQAGSWLLLVKVEPKGTDLDAASHGKTWTASPQNRLERLLRETGVPIGILWNGEVLRLVYVPRGESSGYLTFPMAAMTEVAGRQILSALEALLGAQRLFNLPTNRRLPALLKESRKYQSEVSTRLSEQVLDALWELLRGFQMANAAKNGQLLDKTASEDPQHLYGGLITVLLRLVFLLYAEDKGLMPQDPIYERNYAVTGLYERLRADEGRYSDTMDQRYGAWAWLLSLFRLVYEGGHHAGFSLPARKGELFDPDAYPFLEGRDRNAVYSKGQKLDPPRIPDGVIFSVLSKLLLLDGERLSYRTLDVEQIGSVYEGIMGFAVERASAPSIAVRPKHIVVNLEQLLAAKPNEREKLLKKETECDLTGAALTQLKAAKSVQEVVAAIERKVSPRTQSLLPTGSLYLQPGEERRRTGSHYTPRDLTSPIVQTALRPILEQLGPRATPEQILDLKVCDPAMGSGAFLVEVCRQLSEHLVTAWDVHNIQPELPPDEDILLYARRIVAQRCLYGVDKNPFAVSLAKLSLWLVTLAKDHAFTFLDHALKHGDSLVGFSRQQISNFHWQPITADWGPLFQLLKEQLKEAESYRNDIRERVEEDYQAKAGYLQEADKKLADMRRIGDVLVVAVFSEGNDRLREQKRKELKILIEDWKAGKKGLESLERITGLLDEGKNPIIPFHWEIEFPEVFDRVNGGFDMFVGNPPFAGKNTTINSNPDGYLDWLKVLHAESHGNADLVAHFFRRAFNLLRENGTFGLIATNTVAQGDTRSTGLRWICKNNGSIYEAQKRLKWPGLAAVVVSVVHILKGQFVGTRLLEGRATSEITAFLFHAGGHENPITLKANTGKSFIGSIVLGVGFTFDDRNPEATPIAEMHRLIEKDPRNSERIFPYIGGDEVNSSSTHKHHRYAINFGEMMEHEARQWPDLMKIVVEQVKGTRGKHSTAPWWQFERLRGELFKAIQGLDRVLVRSLTSKHFCFTFLEKGYVYDQTLIVFALKKYSSFCIIHSNSHQVWANFFGATLEDRPRYNITDCFETFPFPHNCETNPTLESVGKSYYEFRAQLMVQNNQGLTDTYNRFHDPDERDPDILKLRELHEAMDRAVLDAYGWQDIPTICEFRLDYEEEEDDQETTGRGRQRKKPWRYKWPEEVHDEVLARLLALNQQRAEEEQLSGTEKEKKPKGSGKRRKVGEQGPTLF